MIAKLFKHEFLRTRIRLLQIIGVSVLVVAAAALFGAMQVPVLSPIFLLLAVLTVIALVPGTQCYLAFDYYRTGFGKEGYLTHALPVRGGKIFTAKLLWAFVVSVVMLVLAVLMLAAIWPLLVAEEPELPRNLFEGISMFWNAIAASLPAWLLVLITVCGLLMVLSMPVNLYFAIAVGCESKLRRFGIGGIVLAFVILYVCMQLLYFVSIVGVPWGIGELPNVPGQAGLIPVDYLGALTANASPEAFPLGILPASMLAIALAIWRTHRSWNKKVSLA
ncbi:hypothetical protein [Gulosibacter bifidus]|uniref:Uncharacterized protein n=1 Tax=Gulosibacter bifidus TaxID=272239 RepID=A0ABW5RHP7_9MICO|nr:hypothetical protein [Gulosibacter bifidus]